MRYLLCLLLLLSTTVALAADTQESLETRLPGRWQGVIAGDFRSQEVSWHFSQDPDGRLRGYMGPTLLGMPEVPMDNLSISGNTLSFSIESQHANYEGRLDNGQITGIWSQGSALPLIMKKKIFAFAVPESRQAQLLGKWHMTQGGTDVELDFRETDTGFLVGNLSIPAIGMHDVPLAEILVTEAGLVTLATDNGRSFIGSMVAGVMFGDYQNGRSQRNGLFVREGFERGQLETLLSETEQQRLLGLWTREEMESIRIDFSQTPEGGVRGKFMIRGVRRDDPVLSIDIRGAEIVMVTEGGRHFVGNLNGNEMSGQYRSGRRPISMTLRHSQHETSTVAASPQPSGLAP
jgi:hypothetical protein